MPHMGPGESPNLELVAALALSANRYGNVASFCNLIDVNFISRATFSRLQSMFLIPAITTAWEREQRSLLEVSISTHVLRASRVKGFGRT